MRTRIVFPERCLSYLDDIHLALFLFIKQKLGMDPSRQEMCVARARAACRKSHDDDEAVATSFVAFLLPPVLPFVSRSFTGRVSKCRSIAAARRPSVCPSAMYEQVDD